MAATVAQIKHIQNAKADIVRVSVPSLEEAEALFGEIRKQVTIPLVAIFILTTILRCEWLTVLIACALIPVILPVRIVCARTRHIRISTIGVNAVSRATYCANTASTTAEALCRIYRQWTIAKHNFEDFAAAVKASDIFMAVAAIVTRLGRIEQPLHLGITEAGGLRSWGHEFNEGVSLEVLAICLLLHIHICTRFRYIRRL